jgi:type IV pilus assembly protein PilP
VRPSRYSGAWWLPGAAAVLVGCASGEMSDLQEYVAQVNARPGGQIEPLPEVKPYERYLYHSVGLRDLFSALFEVPQEALGNGADDAKQQALMHEIQNRNREELENFELDSLRMVGTLENPDNFWGIVKDPKGTVHRVSVGNYLGVNFGKVTNVTEDRIDVREIIKDRKAIG